jgi:hypothetical protein
MANTLNEGAEELLIETVSALSVAGESDYIVIGGWCPYLRNTTDIKHPGTLDVDILFKHGHKEGTLKRSIEALLQNGFVPSAKHPFQLLLQKQVGNQRLIYNVDLLHPRMDDIDKNMFVDQLDLDVPIDEDERRVKKMKSIVQPSSVVLFDENLFSPYKLSGLEFNLVDFTGMFITKMDSCQKQKRERDSFDIYIGFKSELVSFQKLKSIVSKNERIDKSLNQFIDFLRTRSEEFDKNVAESMQPTDPSPANYLEKILCAEL